MNMPFCPLDYSPQLPTSTHTEYINVNPIASNCTHVIFLASNKNSWSHCPFVLTNTALSSATVSPVVLRATSATPSTGCVCVCVCVSCDQHAGTHICTQPGATLGKHG